MKEGAVWNKEALEAQDEIMCCKKKTSQNNRELKKKEVEVKNSESA